MVVLIKKKVDIDDVGRPALFAVYPSDSDKLNKIGEMEQRLFTEKKIRNPRKHNLVFASARFVRDYLPDNHQHKYSDERSIIALIQAENGLCDIIENKNGDKIAVPWSLAFDSMSEDTHDLVLDAMCIAVEAVCKVPVDDFRRNYDKYLGGYK